MMYTKESDMKNNLYPNKAGITRLDNQQQQLQNR